MNFVAPIFPVFLLIVLTVYWLIKARERRLDWLLAASLVFYGWWDWRFLGLIGFVTLLSWASALWAGDRTRSPLTRKTAMLVAVVGNLGLLGVFKYLDFFIESGVQALTAMGFSADAGTLGIILPVGISFYIFQALSYVIDVWRGDLPVESRLRRVGLYIAFFPQLVAGPIVRAASFFPQMDRDHRLTRAKVSAGLKAIFVGLVYKAALADSIAPVVDAVYGNPGAEVHAMGQWANSALIAATLAFAAQIYFDFAGYSLIAIGVAHLFGYYIPQNFNYPYLATSIADFWRRWHMSLSFWLRDYLYIPLGGNRGGEARTYRNQMATMLLGGLWHGAAWTFVAWGALHGAALALHRAFTHAVRLPAAEPLAFAALGWALTQAFVLLTWVPFRAADFDQATEVWAAFAGLRASGPDTLPWSVWLIPALLLLDGALGKGWLRGLTRSPALSHPGVWWALAGACTALILALYPLKPAPFVYFQF
jgi:D-alanyl-lipoteichoic acid acyltransferase DltB (MBOAT superfamily)